MNKIITILGISIYFLLSLNSVFGTSYIYELNEKNKQSSVATFSDASFEFESLAQVLMEKDTGQIIYAHNEEDEMLPASVTKLMTLLLIMERIDNGSLSYDDKVVCSKNAQEMGGSQIWFEEGEELTIEEALKAICIVSANDVTVAMAEMIGGSESNFVAMMNDKAKELGMNNTQYMNSHGIDEEGHHTCAKDQALLARELLLKHPDVTKFTSIWTDELRGGETVLNSTNKLIRFYDGATGLKTGFTSLAMYNLVGSATRGNTTYISVIMHAPSSDVRLQETRTLLDYGFQNFENKKVVSKEDEISQIEVDKSLGVSIVAYPEDDIFVLAQKGSKDDYETKVEMVEDISAPVLSGDVLGKIDVICNDKIIDSINLVSKDEVLRKSFTDYFEFLYKKIFLSSI